MYILMDEMGYDISSMFNHGPDDHHHDGGHKLDIPPLESYLPRIVDALVMYLGNKLPQLGCEGQDPTTCQGRLDGEQIEGIIQEI